MPLRCTCGATLPDDARFCHKCGKPQYEEDIARLSAPDSAPSAPPQTASPTLESSPAALISFKNSRAVTVSLVVAAAAFICMGMAALVSPLLSPLVLMGAGFLATVLYRGNSEQPLSTISGARLGWMTGLWLFVVFVVAGALVSVYLASPAGNDTIKQLQSMPQFSNLAITDSHAVVMNVLLSAIPTFFMVTLLPGLGGILGAKLSRRGHSA